MSVPSSESLLLSRLSKYAKSQPNKQAVAFVASSGEIDQKYTYKELEDITTRLARKLISKGISEGDR